MNVRKDSHKLADVSAHTNISFNIHVKFLAISVRTINRNGSQAPLGHCYKGNWFCKLFQFFLYDKPHMAEITDCIYSVVIHFSGHCYIRSSNSAHMLEYWLTSVINGRTEYK